MSTTTHIACQTTTAKKKYQDRLVLKRQTNCEPTYTKFGLKYSCRSVHVRKQTATTYGAEANCLVKLASVTSTRHRGLPSSAALTNPNKASPQTQETHNTHTHTHTHVQLKPTYTVPNLSFVQKLGAWHARSFACCPAATAPVSVELWTLQPRTPNQTRPHPRRRYCASFHVRGP